MIKFEQNKHRKGDSCLSISKTTLKEFSEIHFSICKNSENGVIKTKKRGYTNRNRNKLSTDRRRQSPKIMATRKIKNH